LNFSSEFDWDFDPDPKAIFLTETFSRKHQTEAATVLKCIVQRIEIDSIWLKRIELFSTLADLSSGIADIAH
jgi:hypothetical protein